MAVVGLQVVFVIARRAAMDQPITSPDQIHRRILLQKVHTEAAALPNLSSSLTLQLRSPECQSVLTTPPPAVLRPRIEDVGSEIWVGRSLQRHKHCPF